MKWRIVLVIVLSGMWLAACGGGDAPQGETAVVDPPAGAASASGSEEMSDETTELETDVSEPVEMMEEEPETAVSESVALIAFSGRLPGERDDIYVMDSAGRNLVNLTDSPEDDNSPVWSPDGAQIAWSVGVGEDLSEIFIMDADGGNKRQLTDLGLDAGTPTWSPDGSQIAFWAGAPGERDIYVVNVDGSELEMLTAEPGDETSPHWSPDGTKIAFTYSTNEGDDIYMVDVSSGALTPITATTLNERVAKWSPDGTELAFFAEVDDQEEIFLMAADGSNVRQLTNQPGEHYFPTWSPDGRFLLYLSRPNEIREFHLLDLTTMTLQRLPIENGVEAGLASVQPVGNSLIVFGGEDIENVMVSDLGDTEITTVAGDSIIATLALTEVQYITESFLGSQTDESIYAGDCIARLLNNGQMVFYEDDSFELILADPTGVMDCFALDDNPTLTGSFQMDDALFTINYNFSAPLSVLSEDEALETFVDGFVGEQLPSGNFRGGFGFSILSSGDFGTGDIFYIVEGDLLADADEEGETVPPIDLVYSINEALAVFETPILLPPPPDYRDGATSNTLSFGAVTKLPAEEAAADYQGYMSGLGWRLTDTFTEGNMIRLGFSRNAESATVTFRQALATTIDGFFQLFGEPWTAVPQIPLPEDAQLSQLYFSQDYDLPVDSDRDSIAQLYEELSAEELAAAGWTLESSSRSDLSHSLIWSRPSGQSSVSISDVSSLNKVGVSFSYNTAVPAITEINVTLSDVGSGQVEALADQFSLHSLTVKASEVDEAAAVAALCSAAADVVTGSPALAAAVRQQCPDGVVEFTAAQVPLAIVINQENDWARNMTTAEAVAALTTAQTWADVNPAWPDTPILRALPTTGTAAYNLLVDNLLGGDAASLSGAANVHQYDTGFGVIWNGVSSGAGAIGFAPIDAVLENADVATAVQLDALITSDNAYPLKLPLVLVTRDTTLQDNLPLAAFVGQTLLPDEETALHKVGYLPVDAATQERNEALWLDAVGE